MITSTTNRNSSYSPSLDNLRSLLTIRSIALLGQTGVLAYVLVASRTTHDLWGVTLALATLALLTVASLWRCTRPWPVTDTEFLAQLLLDVIGWTVLMYFSGGANNPFVSYYIVPLVISAAVLPWRHTWLVAGTSLLAYSGLLYYYQPFPLFTPHAQMSHGPSANVHILGMWFNFLFSAGLITYFVVRMASMLRHQEARAVARREQRLRDEQIMAVASLAAGTAHELGTPLSTMTVLVEEMLQDETLGEQARRDCELLEQQLRQCKHTLTELTRTAEINSAGANQRQALAAFVDHTLQRWAVRRMTESPDRILLVDDDPTFTTVLSRGFQRRGFATLSCASAAEALAACASFQPSHILLDLNMPGTSGLVALPGLLKAAPAARLVVLTGYSSIATAVEATKAGALNYLCKPASIEDILAAFAPAEAGIETAVAERPISVDRLEWEHIQRVLGDHDGNISATARALGMHRRTLQRKLQKRPVRR